MELLKDLLRKYKGKPIKSLPYRLQTHFTPWLLGQYGWFFLWWKPYNHVYFKICCRTAETNEPKNLGNPWLSKYPPPSGMGPANHLHITLQLFFVLWNFKWLVFSDHSVIFVEILLTWQPWFIFSMLTCQSTNPRGFSFPGWGSGAQGRVLEGSW